MSDTFRFADELGPEKVIEIYDPQLALRAVLVIDNTACGPSIGGIRMASDVSVEECFRLARAMTLKNAAAGLPHGGGKSVIFADPRRPPREKEPLIRAFARAIAKLTEYVPGPDMGTNETAMAWVKDENGRSVGLPRELGGVPLDEIGATGFGLTVAAEAAQKFCDVRLEGARVAIQGFGAVGRHAARFLTGKGARLVAVSNSGGAVMDPSGLDIVALTALKGNGRSVAEFSSAQGLTADDLVDVDCDIWIPAARPDVLRADNIGRLKARLVLQGANIPATPEAEAAMASRGILCIPDFIANAGGVICAAVELRHGTETEAFATIAQKIAANTEEVLRAAEAQKILPRTAALAMARKRVQTAMSFRRST